MSEHGVLTRCILIFTWLTLLGACNTDTRSTPTPDDSPWLWESQSVRVEAPNGTQARLLGLKAELSPPPTLPEGYRFISPVLKVTPHGAVFQTPLSIYLNYNANGATEGLAVLRLATPKDTNWTKVESAVFEDRVARFETLTLSYYGVAIPKEDGEETCEGETNGCGGCAELEGEPLAPCGACERGVYLCEGRDAVVCRDDATNACGGCELLEREPGNVCGPCFLDRIVCDSANTIMCDGATHANGCGGCFALSNPPETPCGPCGVGQYACAPDDPNATVCLGASDTNPCGGCEPLQHVLGSPCGPCGRDIYVCDTSGDAVCGGESTNACGGCDPLTPSPGTSCGPDEAYRYICDGEEATVCDCGPRNACGGCAPLRIHPGQACGTCGLDVYACDGEDTVVCDGDTANACGGCEDLEAQPGTPCTTQCGVDVWTCAGEWLVCTIDAPTQEERCCNGREVTDLGNSLGRFDLDFEVDDGQERFFVWEAPEDGYHRISTFATAFETVPWLSSRGVYLSVQRGRCGGDLIEDAINRYQPEGSCVVLEEICTEVDCTTQPSPSHSSVRFHAQAGERFFITVPRNIDLISDDFRFSVNIDRYISVESTDGHVTVSNRATSYFNSSHRLGDVTGDGRDDMLYRSVRFVFGPYSGTWFQIHHGAQGGELTEGPNLDLYSTSLGVSDYYDLLAVGDRTNDGVANIAVLAYLEGEARYHLFRELPNSGSFTVDDAVASSDALGYNAGDLDGDGHDDMLIVHESFDATNIYEPTLTYTGAISVVYGPLEATTRPEEGLLLINNLDPYTRPLRHEARKQPWLMGVDWDGDNNADLMTTMGGVHLFTDLGRSNAPFSPAQATWTVNALTATAHRAGDLNNDGVQDVLLHANGATHLFFGPLTGQASLADANVIWPDTSGYGLGDINDDGVHDIALTGFDIGSGIPGQSIMSGILPGPILDASTASPLTGFQGCMQPFISALDHRRLEDHVVPFTDINGDGVHDVVFAGQSIYVHRGGANFPLTP